MSNNRDLADLGKSAEAIDVDASAPADSLAIDSSGNVGIGTTSPSAKLETKNVTDGSTLAFQATNDNDHEIVQIGTQSDGDGYLTVHGQGASTNIKVQLHSDDDSYFTGGNVGIGTSSPSAKLDVVGDIEVSGGVYVGGTGSANYLDDYEEGTFTPYLQGASTAGVISYYANTTGRYTKIGSVVNILINIEIDTISTAPVGTMRILGLPFTAGTNTGNRLNIQTYGTDLKYTTQMLAYPVNSTTRLQALYTLDNAAWETVNCTTTNFSSGDLLAIAGIYFTDE